MTPSAAETPPKKQPTIREVAAASGVSLQTVSAILNDKPGQASAETRERVLRAVRELGYRPASRWRGAAAARTDTLGVYSGVHSGNVYYQRVLYGVQVAAEDARKHLTLFCQHAWYNNVGANIRRFCDGRCDGLLVIGPDRDDPHIVAMRERGIPLVVVGSSGAMAGGAGAPVDSADVDNVGGSRAATERLIALGHRRIALLPGPEKRASTQQRREGYRTALLAAGIALDPALDVEGEYSAESGRERARAVLSYAAPAGGRPTALVCGNDEIARGAIRGAVEAGLSVPGDVSVFGFDDGPEATDGEPALTTVRQPYFEIGAAALRLLLDRIADPSADARYLALPGEIIERRSVGPPAAPRP
jgi:DNA-binding LacI/PurR family transcriptional regulator